MADMSSSSSQYHLLGLNPVHQYHKTYHAWRAFKGNCDEYSSRSCHRPPWGISAKPQSFALVPGCHLMSQPSPLCSSAAWLAAGPTLTVLCDTVTQWPKDIQLCVVGEPTGGVLLSSPLTPDEVCLMRYNGCAESGESCLKRTCIVTDGLYSSTVDHHDRGGR
jgi:hypothetical protein